MAGHWRGTWFETRRELAQLTWAVVFIDAIALGIGALASRAVGPIAMKVGIGLAVFVTTVFIFVISANLAAESLAYWWIERRDTRSRRSPENR
jgi:hypothetical protein